MSLDNPKSGLGSTVEFQTSALPYVTTGVAPSIVANNIQRIDFPKITRFVTISNLETSGSYLRVSANLTDIWSNTFIKVVSGQTITLELRVTSLYISGNSGTVQFSLCAGLTTIDSIQMSAMPSLASASTFTPKALSPDFWIRADQGITIATGVSQWNDLSGNGRHFTQASGASQPTFIASSSALNNLQGVKFTGTQSMSNGSNLNGLNIQNDYSWWVVVKHDNVPDSAFHTVFGCRALGGLHQTSLYASDTTNQASVRSAGTSATIIGATISLTQPTLYNCVAGWGTNNSVARQNNIKVSWTRSTVNAIGATGVALASDVGTASCTIAEFVMLTRLTTTIEQASMLAYLSTRYNQAWS